MESQKVLDHKGIETIVLRMAYQVREQFFGFEDLVIIGVEGEGYVLAEMIKAQLDAMNSFKSQLYSLNLTKHQSKKPVIQFEPKLPNISGKPVLLVDDVLNSGRTLSYCLSPLVELEIPSLRIAVLVERTYRKFPVSSSITGLSLSTTFEENVVALLKAKPEEMGVFLS
jgi:pyrimidine operon attenuation protein/uracil phosphoribosyltransferase